jgi:hypothetical protein
MVETSALKGHRQIVVEITLGRSEEGAGAKHVRHHRKTLQKFTQLPRISEEDECPARLIKPICKANEGLRGVLNVATSEVDKK